MKKLRGKSIFDLVPLVLAGYESVLEQYAINRKCCLICLRQSLICYKQLNCSRHISQLVPLRENRVYWIVLLISLFGCSVEGVPHTPTLSGLDARRPIAANYLAVFNLRTGDYIDLDNDGVYMCESKTIDTGTGSTIQYRVTGTRAGELSEMTLTLDLWNPETRESDKQLFINMLEVLYIHATRGYPVKKPGEGILPRIIVNRLVHELFVYQHRQTGKHVLAWLKGPIEVSYLKYIGHSLTDHEWLISDKKKLRIGRESLRSNHEWGLPFRIRIIIQTA